MTKWHYFGLESSYGTKVFIERAYRTGFKLYTKNNNIP